MSLSVYLWTVIKKKCYELSMGIVFCEISSFAHLNGLNNSGKNPNV